MRDDSQLTTSTWMAATNAPSQSLLKENIRTDVCVIGAGIAGLTTAYLLGREGRSVVVLDNGLIGGGMTGRTTAQLTNAGDNRYVEFEKLHGTDASRLIAEIVYREKIDSTFHPLEYLDGLTSAIVRDGGRLFGRTYVTKIEGGTEVRIETAHGPVVTSEVVVVTNAPNNDHVPIDDALAFIGRNPLGGDNVYIATGDSRQGMTYGTIAGMLLSDLIQGRPNKWENLYSQP